MKKIESAHQLLEYASPREVQFYETHARLDAGFAPSDTADEQPDPSPEDRNGSDWDVHLMLRQDEIGVRARLNARGPDAGYVVDAAVFYDLSEPLDIPPDVLEEFVNRAAFLALYPFLREALYDAGRKIGAAAPMLGMLDPATNGVRFDFDQASQR